MLTEMRGLSFALFGSALAVAACSVYDASLIGPGKGGGNGNGGQSGGGGNGTGADGGPGGGGSVNAYCGASQRAIYPSPPAMSGTSAKNIEIVGAQYTIDLGDSPSAATEPTRFLGIGFDLDNFCTTQADPKAGTCKAPSYGFGVSDGKGGIDNALGGLIQHVRDLITDFTSDHYSEELQAGKSNVMLHMTGWNGEPNDDQVTLSTLVAAPFDSFTKDGKVPKWDGTDAWPIASDTVNGTVDKAKFTDTSAYVSNNQVVGTLDNADLGLVVQLTSIKPVILNLRLTSAFVVCNIVKQDADAGKWGYGFEKCTLGGRWSANDLVKQLGQYPDPLNKNAPLCRGTTEYETFKKQICSQTDVTADPTLGPTKPCDALSMGVTYTMKQAMLGDVFK